MWIVNKLKSLFGNKANPVPQEQKPIAIISDESLDPLEVDVITQAFRSGKPVIGTRDESGKVTIRKLDR